MSFRLLGTASCLLWFAGACTEEVCPCPDHGGEAEAGEAGDIAEDTARPDAGDADAVADAEADVDGTDATDAETVDDAEAEAEADVSPTARFSFVVFADNQFATESCTSGVSERLAIPEEIVALAPDFILESGDLADHAYDPGAYEHFESCYDGMLAAAPFFPTMGNHDAAGGGIWDYKTYLERQLFTTNPAVWPGAWASDFTVWYEDDPTVYSTDFDAPTHRDSVPSGVSFKTFYAFRHQNAYFVSMEVGTRYWSNTPKTWLDEHLAAANADPTIEHIFVFLHHPIYSTTMADTASGECTGPVRDNYEPYFRDNDVTMVFSGHAHVYDRFYVPDDGHRTADAPPASYPHDGSGVHYIVTGGGGGPLPSCSPMPSASGVVGWDYSQARGCGYHVTRVEVDGSRLTVSAIGVAGTAADFTTDEWDRFTIE